MQIIDYKYIHGTELNDGFIAIPELNRTKASALQFIKLAELDIELTQKTAFIYVDGFSLAQSDSGLSATDPNSYLPAIKSGVSYIAHEWVHTFKNKNQLVKVDTVSGTCAAGIHALYEAERLLSEKTVSEVIIIGGERTTKDTVRLFKELAIPVVCGDGFVYLRLRRGGTIRDIQWKYKFEDNPFLFTKDTLNSLKPNYIVNYVKVHGTGTESNEKAEFGLRMLGDTIRYKHMIGHTQGISALLETCMVLDNSAIKGTILVTANGVGGYYGCFTLSK